MEQIKVGIIGSGVQAELHAQALLAVPQSEIVAVASPNLHRVVDVAKRYEIPRALTNYRDLLKIEDIDVVALAIPTDLHREVTLAAAENGKHVLCESPLALTIDDANAMIDACATAQVQLLYLEPFCFAPVYAHVRDLITRRALGEVFLIKHTQGNAGPSNNWGWDIDRSGGGALMHPGIQGIGLARWLFDGANITHVTASMGTFVHGGRTQGEDHAIVILNFAGGQMAVIESGWTRGSGPENRLDISGTGGHTRADLFDSTALPVWSTILNRTQPDVGTPYGNWSFSRFDDLWQSGYIQQMRYFIDCLVRDEPSQFDGMLGRNALEVVAAAYRSARIGTTIRLPFRVPGTMKRPVDLWIGTGAN